MPSVFLSHSSKDKPLACQIARDLESAHVDVWLDAWQIRVGDSISQCIETGLGKADFVAVLLTRESVKSSWVGREWRSRIGAEADDRQVIILPLLAEDCEVPLLLRDRKYADFRRDYRTAIDELVEDINRHAGIQPPQERRQPAADHAPAEMQARAEPEQVGTEQKGPARWPPTTDGPQPVPPVWRKLETFTIAEIFPPEEDSPSLRTEPTPGQLDVETLENELKDVDQCLEALTDGTHAGLKREHAKVNAAELQWSECNLALQRTSHAEIPAPLRRVITETDSRQFARLHGNPLFDRYLTEHPDGVPRLAAFFYAQQARKIKETLSSDLEAALSRARQRYAARRNEIRREIDQRAAAHFREAHYEWFRNYCRDIPDKLPDVEWARFHSELLTRWERFSEHFRLEQAAAHYREWRSLVAWLKVKRSKQTRVLAGTLVFVLVICACSLMALFLRRSALDNNSVSAWDYAAVAVTVLTCFAVAAFDVTCRFRELAAYVPSVKHSESVQYSPSKTTQDVPAVRFVELSIDRVTIWALGVLFGMTFSLWMRLVAVVLQDDASACPDVFESSWYLGWFGGIVALAGSATGIRPIRIEYRIISAVVVALVFAGLVPLAGAVSVSTSTAFTMRATAGLILACIGIRCVWSIATDEGPRGILLMLLAVALLGYVPASIVHSILSRLPGVAIGDVEMWRLIGTSLASWGLIFMFYQDYRNQPR